MAISDLFKIQQYKDTINKLQNENNRLQTQANLKLTVQQMTPIELNNLIEKKQNEFDFKKRNYINEENQLKKSLNQLTNKKSDSQLEINKLQAQLDSLQKELDDTEDTMNMETYGLYKPRYNFANSLGYKNQLNDVRNNQKRMIRNLEAYEIFNPMLLDNSSSKGHSMQKKNGKQLVRSFNVE
ncbi:MAG TPA: DUF4041 domain-containing protein, partial [Companilactobacillus farciminis]|nr:DUF4041 domain-containing protein [Companilactobacillus farciminis]